ncbi:trihelix transcription factor GT-2-like [Alligator mississippiensis]|uniref:Trihelix transcription factor GT-2-like n=2 Tax=Alligator mississippiensis TaxID=8496 RepID=A0A151P417_ALLMI|nr:trihelix transcription factor GT-2-like [Alligator mississippiensis]
MPRGQAWSPQEVGCLLALIRGCGAVGLLMASTSRPNEARWREISRGLAAAGYGRSVAQCRAKWKALKQAFYSERETRRQPGARPPRTPPHYRAMERLWEAAGRPVFGERRLPALVKLPPVRRRPSLQARSPSAPELPAPQDATSPAQMVPAPVAHSPGEHQAETAWGAQDPAVPVIAGDQALPETAVEDEHLDSEEASAAALQGPGAAHLLQSMQQLLVQILQTSRRQQALLESLASDTVSRLHGLSDSLAQVGETLQELLLRAQPHPMAPGGLPTPLNPDLCPRAGSQPPLLPREPGVPSAPRTLPYRKEPTVPPTSAYPTPRFTPH